MNYVEHINFNKDCIRQYNQQKENNPDYLHKIYLLLKENIGYYSEINKFKRMKELKPIQTTKTENKPFKSLYFWITDSTYKEATVQDMVWMDYDLYLQHNL